MSMARHFISFANKTYKKALKRITSEAESIGVFESVQGFTPKDFGNDFLAKHQKFIKKNKRGYGFFIWKSYFIQRTLRTLNDGDILVYADAGCKFYHEYLPRLHEYFDIVTQSPQGILCFEFGEWHSAVGIFCREPNYGNRQLVAERWKGLPFGG